MGTATPGPKYPRVTPRRSIVMDDETWALVNQLAARWKIDDPSINWNASVVLRHAVHSLIESARETGELPTPRKTRRAA